MDAPLRFGGIEAARRRTDEVDARILAAVTSPDSDQTGLPATVALVAVGSYGRRELTAGSDVDVLVLHALKNRAAVQQATKALLYPLWDAGFELGYAVRTVGECLQAAKADPVIATTLFDTRLLAGDPATLDALAGDLSKWKRKHGTKLARALLGSLAERHARFGDAGADIEPHVKEGRGGLRDLQTLRWLQPDAGAGPLDAEEIDDALDLLLAIRSALHEAAGKREDRLRADKVDAVAAALGFVDGDPSTAEETDPVLDARDELLAALFRTCRRIGARLGWLERRTLHPARRERVPAGFAVSDGELVRTDPSSLVAQPAAGLAAALAVSRVPPSRQLLDWAAANHGQIRWDDATRSTFEQVLAEGAAATWELLDVTGLWVRYLPELASGQARTQHNPLHEVAVDAHCWRTVGEARSLLDGSAPLPYTNEAVAGLESPVVLLLAAFLHDQGKGTHGDHSRVGVILARRILERMGYGADVQQLVAFLVGDHLLLPEFATGRDLNDEELVIGLAARIATPQRLRLLYLLSIADARATGPAAWSQWKAQLLTELYVKLLHVVDSGDLVGRDADNTIRRTRAEVERTMPGAATAVQKHLDLFPRRYLLTQPAGTVCRHIELVEALTFLGGAGAIDAIDGDTLTVVTNDRPGLLATITGVLSVHGVNVLTADIYTRADGVAVDVVTVADRHDATVPAQRWERVRNDLAAALDVASDPAGLTDRVRERSARYAVADATPAGGDVEITIDNDSSDWYSVVEVRSADRVGLLYELTSILAELDLNVHFAKVSTQAGAVRDSFSVRTADGRKLNDPDGVAAAIRGALLDRLGLGVEHGQQGGHGQQGEATA